jgi:hypothetical protein
MSEERNFSSLFARFRAHKYGGKVIRGASECQQSNAALSRQSWVINIIDSQQSFPFIRILFSRFGLPRNLDSVNLSVFATQIKVDSVSKRQFASHATMNRFKHFLSPAAAVLLLSAITSIGEIKFSVLFPH